MAVIPADEKVFMVSNGTNTTYGGSAALKAMQQWYTMEDVTNTVRPYRVFTALLTQSGGSLPQTIYIGTNYGNQLLIGCTYEIMGNDTTDFTNVGAPNNNVGTSFIATGNNPNNQNGNDNTYLDYDTGAPVVNVLENTIGNIWFTFLSDGDYFVNSDNLFVSQKTFGIIGTGFENIVNNNVTGLVCSSSTQLFLQTGLITTVPVVLANDILSNTPIEIRVYN